MNWKKIKTFFGIHVHYWGNPYKSTNATSRWCGLIIQTCYECGKVRRVKMRLTV